MNSIFRKVSLGLAIEDDYGVYSGTSSTFTLGTVELALTETIDKVDNVSMLGSTVETNDIRETVRRSEFSITGKVSEDVFPALFKQKFSIASEQVSGETTVYRHELTYANKNEATSGESYTLFWDDPDRGDMYINGARWDNIDIEAVVDGFVTFSISGVGKYPAYTGITNTISGVPLDFVGRNVGVEMGDYDGAVSAAEVLSATFKHQFNLSQNEDNYALGDGSLKNLFTTADTFETELTSLFPDNTIKTLWETNDKRQSVVTIEDDTRFVEGSVTSVRPSIVIEYPAQFISAWTRQGGANDILKQQFTMKAVDDPAIADCPMKIVVINNTASY